MPTGAVVINSALINSQVLRPGQYNFGMNLQWQPMDEWYAMAGGSIGAGPLVMRLGLIIAVKTGLCPLRSVTRPRIFSIWDQAFIRIQPFVAGANDTTGGGLCFNLQQQLGSDSPFGWFGRFGFGDSKVTSGAAAQAGTGFVIQGPFKHLLLQRTSNDFLGVGFIWASLRPRARRFTTNRYGMEDGLCDATDAHD